MKSNCITEQNIFSYFEKPAPIFLPYEVAVTYVGWMLLQKPSYGSEMERFLLPTRLRVSDTILMQVLKWMHNTERVTYKKESCEGRGRPKKLYSPVASETHFFTQCSRHFEAWCKEQGIELPLVDP